MAEGAETLRSRLYRLETQNGEEVWVQRGEGYPEFKREESLFRLRYYSTPGRDLLYDITVDTNIQFQRSENGIQWTQVRENQVMAISFKEQFSANAFWQLIEQYQKKYAISVPAADGIYFYFEYKVPDPSPNNLQQVLSELQAIPEGERHERVASIFLTKRDLLPRLLGVFRRVQQTNELPKLQLLFQIVRIIFNASNEQLFYELMCNQAFMGILGILEYDPNFRSQRPRHRQFMLSRSKLLEVVPFRSAPELLNLVVFTYRLQYIRECVLFPYLNDNGFGSSGCIIRNNYKKIFNNIFNSKRRDFINSLYDLLRLQDLPAFKLLRELFRIARIHYMPEIYREIAERDTFDIFIRNLREFLLPDVAANKKRKKKPEEMEQIALACLEILQQYMEHQPIHLRNYLISEGQKVAKFPSCEFLLDQFQNGPPVISQKLGIILKSLFGVESHPLKDIFKGKILQKFLSEKDSSHTIKWMPLLAQIMLPLNEEITSKMSELIPLLIGTLKIGTKTHQIFHLSTLKIFFQNYFPDQAKIEEFLVPRANQLVDYLWKNRGADGIRVSAFLSLFLPLRFIPLLVQMIKILQQRSQGNGLIQRCISMLQVLSKRKQICLPIALKRDKSEQYLDEENFQKLSKKIKID